MMKEDSKEKLYKQVVYAQGMHCASCEVLIEKTLSEYKGVKKVKSSLLKGEIEVFTVTPDKIDVKKLNKDLNNLGYKFSLEKPSTDKYENVHSSKSKYRATKSKIIDLLKIAILFSVVVILVVLVNNSSLVKYANVDTNSSFPTFLTFGFIASLTSCAALVGSLLLVMTKQWYELYTKEESPYSKYKPHLLFHIGRLLGFFVLGGVLGLLGKGMLFVNLTKFTIIVIVVSVIMLILALQMLGVESAKKLKFTTPKFISKYIVDEKNFSGKYMPFVLGVFTFLLPCGFTLIVQSTALASSDFLRGGLIMFAFAVGSLPILLVISITGVQFNSSPKLTEIFNKIAGILILVFAIYTINNQLNVLGVKSLNDIKVGNQPNNEIVISDKPQIRPGLQQVIIVADESGYKTASSIFLKAGKPSVIAVNNKGVQGCGQFMSGRGLFDGYVELKPGWNYIEFTPERGEYKLTCTMGMVSPITIKVV